MKAARLRELISQRSWLFVGIASGAVFVAIFARFSPLPRDAFVYRDDAVITLSHARNLVDFGSIGVDAAGARVEGFSAPLQFWIFVFAYAVTHCGFAAFLDLQVLICTFALGFAVVQLFRRSYAVGLVLSALVAVLLTHAVRFFGWHQSGMENAYTHVLFVATLACCVNSLETGTVRPLVLICGWCASMVRLESILHVLPVLLIWAATYRVQQNSWRALHGVALILIAWGSYQCFRYVYFGDLRPNTAIAEQIDVWARVKGLVAANPVLRAETFKLDLRIAREHRLYLAFLSIPLLVLGTRRRAQTALVLMLFSLMVTGLVHPMLFGPARLDPVRTTTHVALVAPLLLATQWVHLGGISRRLWSLASLAIALAIVTLFETPPDTFFCCPIKRAESIAQSCLAHAQRERLQSPSLASPDLGKQSFEKRFLMFDLGLLGNPPMAVLNHDDKATANYLLELAAPDFIELHGAWACGYRYLQSDPRFIARYSLVPGSRGLGLADCGSRTSAGIWFRNDVARSSGTRERQLIDDLSVHLDADRIARELRSCRLQASRLACVYVTRSVYRFIPRLVHSGHLERVAALFRHSPSAEYDASVLGARSNGLWYRNVVAFVRLL